MVHESESEVKTKANLNTILVSISIAMLMGMCGATWNNSIKLAEISSSMIPRAEIEAKFNSVKIEQQRLDIEIQEIRLQITKYIGK